MKVYAHNSAPIKWIDGAKECKNVKEAEVVVFPGGADINPKLYKHSKSLFSGHPEGLEEDKRCVLTYGSAKEGVLYIGICRGAQLLTAMAGGCLIQHVTGHNADDHPVIFNAGIVKKYGIKGYLANSNSFHHQMMNPFMLNNDDYEIIGYTDGLSAYYIDEGGFYTPPKNFVEPEIVYYNKINALAIQFHPEWHNPDSDIVRNVNSIIKKIK